MGVKGYGNFDDDSALDYLWTLQDQLIKAIENYFTNYIDELDLDDGNAILLPSLDILTTLCLYYQVAPGVDVATVQVWKDRYLEAYDAHIDEYGVGSEYKMERRKVISITFKKLEEIANNFT